MLPPFSAVSIVVSKSPSMNSSDFSSQKSIESVASVLYIDSVSLNV